MPDVHPPLKVFLVEDSALFRERLAELLVATAGIDIVGWADAEQPAIHALCSTAWDVLILDLHLRHGNGMGVLRALQDIGRPAHTRVIVLTDHDFYLYRSKSLEYGADMFCAKSREATKVVKLLKEMNTQRSAAPANSNRS